MTKVNLKKNESFQILCNSVKQKNGSKTAKARLIKEVEYETCLCLF